MAAPRFLIVDEKDRPMAWSEKDKQLCYCTTEQWRGEKFPATSYVKEDAQEHIKTTKANRRKWEMSEGQFFLMPFE